MVEGLDVLEECCTRLQVSALTVFTLGVRYGASLYNGAPASMRVYALSFFLIQRTYKGG
jgi:hypothetical protein